MDKIGEIIRRKQEAQLSERAISRALNISRPLVTGSSMYEPEINPE